MKDQILEVQNYLNEKLVNGDFKVEAIRNNCFEVVVDGAYHFRLWLGGMHLGSISLFGDENFMFIKFSEIDQRELAGKLSKLLIEKVTE